MLLTLAHSFPHFMDLTQAGLIDLSTDMELPRKNIRRCAQSNRCREIWIVLRGELLTRHFFTTSHAHCLVIHVLSKYKQGRDKKRTCTPNNRDYGANKLPFKLYYEFLLFTLMYFMSSIRFHRTTLHNKQTVNDTRMIWTKKNPWYEQMNSYLYAKKRILAVWIFGRNATALVNVRTVYCLHCQRFGCQKRRFMCLP